MVNVLRVSKRTVYRELEQLERSLKGSKCFAEKITRGSFMIEATPETMTQLRQLLNEKRWNYRQLKGNMQFY